MRDIELNSCVMSINGWPAGTHKIRILYDSRGWAIRCYDEDGNKLVTMVTDTEISEYTTGEARLVASR